MISVWLPPTYRLVPFNHGFDGRVIGVPTIDVRAGTGVTIEDPTMIPQLKNVGNRGGMAGVHPTILVELRHIGCRHPFSRFIEREQKMVVTLRSFGNLEQPLTTVNGTELGMSILIVLDQIERLGTGLTSNLDSRPSNMIVRALLSLRVNSNGYLA